MYSNKISGEFDLSKYLFLGLFLLISGVEIFAQTARVISSNGLVVRERPGKDYKKIGGVPKKAIVRILDASGPQDKIDGKKSEWVRIEYGSLSGWVFGAYLKEIKSPSLSKEKFQLYLASAWNALDRSPNTCMYYDYFPQGGMRIFYCHLSHFMTYADLQSYLGFPIFLKGPHSNRDLDWKSLYSFGHYNPEFVKWISEAMIPGATDSNFLRITQAIYDSSIKPLARTTYKVHQIMELHDSNSEELKEELVDFLQTRKGEYDIERFYSYLEDHGINDTGYDGNVVKTCVGFWLRRRIDGTKKDFFQGLVKLLKAYDNQFLINNG